MGRQKDLALKIIRLENLEKTNRAAEGDHAVCGRYFQLVTYTKRSSFVTIDRRHVESLYFLRASLVLIRYFSNGS